MDAIILISDCRASPADGSVDGPATEDETFDMLCLQTSERQWSKVAGSTAKVDGQDSRFVPKATKNMGRWSDGTIIFGLFSFFFPFYSSLWK